MVASLDNLAFFKHHDCVGITDGAQPVRDDENRSASHKLVHTLFNKVLGSRVDRARRLVEHKHGRVCNRGSCYHSRRAGAL